MKTAFISILALSFLTLGAHAQSTSASPELKNLEAEKVQHYKDHKEKLAKAYEQYKAAKAAAAAAFKAANVQAEKDFKKAKEQIAQEDRDFNTKYKEIKMNLAQQKKTAPKAEAKPGVQPAAQSAEPKK